MEAPQSADLSSESTGLGNYPLKDIGTPHPHDVLCGRGGGTNNHIGNTHWRMLVAANKQLYISLPKRQKMLLSRSIVHAVRSQNPPGRFLQKNSKTDKWYDIGDQRAQEKTSQALREGAPDLRDKLSKEKPDEDATGGQTDDTVPESLSRAESAQTTGSNNSKANSASPTANTKPLKSPATSGGAPRPPVVVTSAAPPAPVPPPVAHDVDDDDDAPLPIGNEDLHAPIPMHGQQVQHVPQMAHMPQMQMPSGMPMHYGANMHNPGHPMPMQHPMPHPQQHMNHHPHPQQYPHYHPNMPPGGTPAMYYTPSMMPMHGVPPPMMMNERGMMVPAMPYMQPQVPQHQVPSHHVPPHQVSAPIPPQGPHNPTKPSKNGQRHQHDSRYADTQQQQDMQRKQSRPQQHRHEGGDRRSGESKGANQEDSPGRSFDDHIEQIPMPPDSGLDNGGLSFGSVAMSLGSIGLSEGDQKLMETGCSFGSTMSAYTEVSKRTAQPNKLPPSNERQSESRESEKNKSQKGDKGKQSNPVDGKLNDKGAQESGHVAAVAAGASAAAAEPGDVVDVPPPGVVDGGLEPTGISFGSVFSMMDEDKKLEPTGISFGSMMSYKPAELETIGMSFGSMSLTESQAQTQAQSKEQFGPNHPGRDADNTAPPLLGQQRSKGGNLLECSDSESENEEEDVLKREKKSQQWENFKATFEAQKSSGGQSMIPPPVGNNDGYMYPPYGGGGNGGNMNYYPPNHSGYNNNYDVDYVQQQMQMYIGGQSQQIVPSGHMHHPQHNSDGYGHHQQHHHQQQPPPGPHQYGTPRHISRAESGEKMPPPPPPEMKKQDSGDWAKGVADVETMYLKRGDSLVYDDFGNPTS